MDEAASGGVQKKAKEADLMKKAGDSSAYAYTYCILHIKLHTNKHASIYKPIMVCTHVDIDIDVNVFIYVYIWYIHCI